MYGLEEISFYFLLFIGPSFLAYFLFDSWKKNKRHWYKLILAILIGLVAIYFLINWLLAKIWPLLMFILY